MSFRKTPLALAAIALCSGFPLQAQTTSTTIEAESMTLSTYQREGTRIRLPSSTSTGSAATTFNGPSGTYNIQVHVVPEDDGRPTLEVHKGSTRLHAYTYPQQTSAASFTVNNVALNPGDVIRLAGRADRGAYARVDKIVLTQVSAAASSMPYSGTPIALPKAFEAANFDKGGQGVAYKDLTPGNDGGQYRAGEDVDIVASSDSLGGPYAVRNFQAGEWMNYTVNVPSNGSYDLAVRVANNLATPPSFHIEVDGKDVTGPLSVPNTGSVSSFQWVGKAGVPLTAGKRIVKVVADQEQFSLNAISALAAASAPAPSAGSASTMEAESMTLSTYTVEGSRIGLPSGTATGTAAGAFAGPSGTYDIDVHVVPEDDGRPTLEVHKGAVKLASYTYPLQTAAASFRVAKVALSAGETIKLVGRGDAGARARVDKLVFSPVSGTGEPAPAPEPSAPSTSTIEAESMTLATYKVESNRIGLPSGTATGTATQAFSGASGKYDLQVHVVPEDDGRPTLEVHKGATRLTTYTYPLQTSPASFKVSGVTLNSGEVIKLVGRGDAGARARVDKIVLTPSTTSSAPAPSDPVATPTEPAPVGTACANPSSGYEGFGRNTTGGAGKTIYRVTNLKDSGSGSLRDALSQGNRCVVFDVAGTISLSSNLVVRGANVTIDGLTAPSPGITLKNRTLVMQGSSGSGNVVVRGIRHRGTPSGEDAIRVYGASNIVIDRVSVSGFGDGAIDVTEKSRDITIQWSILGEGAPSHNLLSLIGLSASRVTAHHNLYINGDGRHPKIAGPNGATSPWSTFVGDVRNNLIWNFGNDGTSVRHGGVANVVNNYYYSPKSSASRTIWVADGGAAYTSGNVSKNGWNINGNGNRSSPYAVAAVTTTDAVTAAQQVLAHAGARGPRFGLDSTDQSYVGQVKLD